MFSVGKPQTKSAIFIRSYRGYILSLLTVSVDLDSLVEVVIGFSTAVSFFPPLCTLYCLEGSQYAQLTLRVEGVMFSLLESRVSIEAIGNSAQEEICLFFPHLFM